MGKKEKRKTEKHTQTERATESQAKSFNDGINRKGNETEIGRGSEGEEEKKEKRKTEKHTQTGRKNGRQRHKMRNKQNRN